MKASNIVLNATLIGCAGFYALTGFAASAEPTPAKNWMPIKQVIEKVEAQGFTNIESIERDHGQYEVKAINKDGVRTKLYLNSESGDILKKHEKSHKKDGDKKSRHEKKAANAEPAPAPAK